ncbi:hypothetical protein KA005_02990 [bacterium]|nr:hypothetical protein [bacterium]
MREKVKIFLVGLCLLVIWGCNNSNQVDFSGRFYVIMGPNPRGIMDVTQSDNGIIFTLVGAGFSAEGTGTVTENIMTLSASFSQLGSFEASVTSSDDGESFSGFWTISGQTFMEGTLSGTRTQWETYDIEAFGIPLFISVDCIELSKMEKVSKFRSGHGFDYSDDFETCRSMKHSFALKPGENPAACQIFAPFNGTVIGTLEDWEGTTFWKGTTIGLQPDSFKAFWVLIYHVNLDSSFQVGDHVNAGQILGKPKKEDGGTTIAVWVHTPNGDKLLSYFQVISDNLFVLYQQRGLYSREAAIISKEERDANPLTCQGEEIIDKGTLAHWFFLN